MTALGFALALLVGLSLGLLGGGGAILTVPIFHYVMGFDVKLAVPMSLVVVGITSGVGAVRFWRTGTLIPRVLLAFGPAAIVGALLGAELGLLVSGRVQLTVFAAVLLLAAISMYLGPVWAPIDPATQQHTVVPPKNPMVLEVLVGAAVGTLTGFVGVGGGFLYVPTLVLLAGLPMKEAIGTSLGLIMISCLAGVVRYQGSLELDWRTVAIFTAVALLGLAVGSRLVLHASQRVLRRSFAALLLLMGGFVLALGR